MTSFLKQTLQSTLIFLILSTLGCASSSRVNSPVTDIFQVAPNLYRGERPDAQKITELKLLGVRTILSLEEDPKHVNEVRNDAHQIGLHFINIPLSVYRRPTDAEALEFLRTTLDPELSPVYVHCDKGKDRTGAMIALYRIVAQGWGPKEGYNEAKEYGYWPYRGDAELKKFILQMNDHKKHYREVSGIKL